MNCHECAATGVARTADAICRFCSVGLCKDHLVASFHSTTATLYACDHHPEQPYSARTVPVREDAVAAAGQPVRP